MSNFVYQQLEKTLGEKKKSKSEVLSSFLFFFPIFFCIILMLVSQAEA